MSFPEVPRCYWDHTCFTDPTTEENCTDVINGFPDVDDMSDLPLSDLCSYCNTRQMAIMQEDGSSNQYTADWQSAYKETALKCNFLVANFNATQSVFNVTVSVGSSNTPSCASGQTYTTKGDTCDSIALEYSVSAATMYSINPNILNYSSI